MVEGNLSDEGYTLGADVKTPLKESVSNLDYLGLPSSSHCMKNGRQIVILLQKLNEEWY